MRAAIAAALGDFKGMKAHSPRRRSCRTDRFGAFLVIKFRRESDSPTLGLGLHHQTTNCVKDHLELAVVSSYLFFSCVNLPAKSLCSETDSRNRTNARMISMFT